MPIKQQPLRIGLITGTWGHFRRPSVSMDLRAAVGAARLELRGVVPSSDATLLGRLEPGVLKEVRRNHPTASMEDLLRTLVAAIVRRPR